jgi:hypothetical protein
MIKQQKMSRIKVIKPNDRDQKITNGVSIFLAGSIEMGKAEDWQKTLTSELKSLGKGLTVFNPRRDDWDSSWEQKQSNVQFNRQVSWELNKLEECDVIFMYFSPETQSPISLLELGKFAGKKEMIVCCPEGFWRKGNVEILCTRENVPLFNDIESAIGALKTKINQYERN